MSILKSIILLLFVLFVKLSTANESLKQRLLEIPNVHSVKSIKIDTNFNCQFEFYFTQSIDHENPNRGTFNQRVILSHKSDTLSMVVDLEGYHIWSGTASEPTLLLNANQLTIEHRYFKDSKPDSIDWETLTIWQAATDQHKIIQALKPIYEKTWLTTGISKGGQTTMFHKTFYPNDADASIVYVAPLNFKREDERLYSFLDNVGTEEQRKLIREFQKSCFAKADSLEILLNERVSEQDWQFKFGVEKAVWYTILEYDFAFWQWGNTNFSEIPKPNSSAKTLFKHLNIVADFTFFEEKSLESFRPFYWAALTQIGMYGYRTEPFSEFFNDSLIFTFLFAAPEGTSPVYDTAAMYNVKQFLDTEAQNMLFVVGGLDPWGATSYEPSGNNNLVKIVLENGHHGTRIADFPDEEKEKVYKLLQDWMKVDVILD